MASTSTMKAVRVRKFGGPEVLKLEDVPKPTPEAGQVLIQLKAAGVNPLEPKICHGVFPEVTEKDLPYTPGGDGAGVVAAVGEGVKSFKAGDRVLSCEGPHPASGVYAEFAVVPEKHVFPLPDKVSFSQGAAAGVAYLTALQSIMHRAKAKAGECVLVHGASGGVGLACIQIASAWKMNVFGTAGTDEGLELIRKNGAAHTFNHREKDYAKKLMEANGGKGFDVILEMMADKNFGSDLDMLVNHGRIVIIGAGGPTKIDTMLLRVKEYTVDCVMLTQSSDEEWKKIGDELTRGLKEEWLRPVIDKEFPLNKIADAFKEQMEHKGGAKGKIVLTIP